MKYLAVCLLGLSIAGSAAQADWSEGMKMGTVRLKSVGPIAFGPEGILLIADTKAASVVALKTTDEAAEADPKFRVEAVDERIAAVLGATAEDILIEDLAIHPTSREAYLSVWRGRGPDGLPLIVRVGSDGNPEVVAMDYVLHSVAELPDAPIDGVVGQGRRASNPRQESITDIAFFQDRVLVAGLANEEFASTFRAIPFPFETVEGGSSVEIFHGAHGRFETRAPIRTFVPMNIGSEPSLLAAYTCTPLVQFPISDVTPGAKIQGKTIAELGNRNRPLDMVVYQKDGVDYLLLANSSRGVMKIATGGIEGAEKIEARVSEERAGVGYETIASWSGVLQLDLLGDSHAITLRDVDEGRLVLEALPLP